MSRAIDAPVALARRTLARGLLSVLMLAHAACAGDGARSAAPIERESFIATYVDLRIAALDADSGLLTDEARAAVLASHGVTSDELLAFADAHGRDVEFMRDVWNEVEVRMDERRPSSEDPG